MKTWSCKIGEIPPEEYETLDKGEGGDQRMRTAVAAAYREFTGQDPTYIFSGWGAELDEGERAVVEDREPDYFKTGWLEHRLHELRAHFRGPTDDGLPAAGDGLPTDWTPEQWVTTPMIKLGEAAYFLHAGIEGSRRLTARDKKTGIECLMATAASCLDAVEALESHGEEAPAAEQAATG